MVPSEFSYEEHTADVKVRAIGTDFPSALSAAARACTNLLTPIAFVKPQTERQLLLHASTKERALFLFLEELIYLLDTAHFVVCDANLVYRDGVLSGTLRGDDISRYERHGDLKAPTKHDLAVQEQDSHTELTFVIDI